MRMRLTLLQMMKLVLACAFAMAYVLPLIRLAEAGIASWPAMLAVAAVGVPLVFALATILLARDGRLKRLLIRILLLSSVGVALGVETNWFVRALSVWFARGLPLDLRTLSPLVAVGCFEIVLGLVVNRLLRGVMSNARIPELVQGETER